MCAGACKRRATEAHTKKNFLSSSWQPSNRCTLGKFKAIASILGTGRPVTLPVHFLHAIRHEK